MTIHVVKPGALSTLQDLGRFGYQRYGVIVDGAMDEWAHRVANLLVGNRETEAVLEITLIGPSLAFDAEVGALGSLWPSDGPSASANGGPECQCATSRGDTRGETSSDSAA